MDDWKPNIFEYLDYRQYLNDYYERAKAHHAAFSFRYFARRAQLSSPSFLRHVMRGERNLGGESIHKFAQALGLDQEESKFFDALVHFNQAKTSAEKLHAFELVAASRRFGLARRVDKAMFEYFSHWYYPAIREMASREDFQEDPAWVAGQLLPSIEPAQASEALQTLEEIGLLERDESGRLRRSVASVTTGHEVRSLAIASYHRQMLHRASESIEIVDRAWRDLGAMTVCISPQTAAEIKARIHAFRELLLEICDRESSPSVVYQFNTQLFPLSKLPASE